MYDARVRIAVALVELTCLLLRRPSPWRVSNLWTSEKCLLVQATQEVRSSFYGENITKSTPFGLIQIFNVRQAVFSYETRFQGAADRHKQPLLLQCESGACSVLYACAAPGRPLFILRTGTFRSSRLTFLVRDSSGASKSSRNFKGRAGATENWFLL